METIGSGFGVAMGMSTFLDLDIGGLAGVPSTLWCKNRLYQSLQ